MKKFIIHNVQLTILITIFIFAISPGQAQACQGADWACSSYFSVGYNQCCGGYHCSSTGSGDGTCVPDAVLPTSTPTPIPTLTPTPTPTPTPVPCVDDGTTLTYSPNPAYQNDSITFTASRSHTSQRFVFSPSPYSGDYIGKGAYAYQNNAQLVCAEATQPPNASTITCTAQNPRGPSYTSGGGNVVYQWYNGSQWCNVPPAPPTGVTYSWGPRPKPTLPTICRNPSLTYHPMIGANYSNLALTVNRPAAEIKNNYEDLYIQTINAVGIPAAERDLVSSLVFGPQRLSRTDNSPTFPGNIPNIPWQLYTGVIYQPILCNTNASSMNDTTNCSRGSLFCISGWHTGAFPGPDHGHSCATDTITSATTGTFLDYYLPPECIIPPPVYCGSGEARSTGLVSAPGQTGNFATTGACIINKDATFIPDRIDSYAGLKLNYYTQAKSSGTVTKHLLPLTGENTQANIPLTANLDHIYQISGNLTISGNIPGNQTGVIFVDGNLNISNDITTGANAGLVFVVGGDVNIAPTVTKINAVIISSGTIYTAGAGCSFTTNNVTGSTLTINGSLVSLDETKPVKFCRKLLDNTLAAEKIIHDPKYQIILRDLFARKEQFWSEITGAEVLPTAVPTPVPTATPTPTTPPTPIPIPANPTTPTHTCNADGTSVVLTWAASSPSILYKYNVSSPGHSGFGGYTAATRAGDRITPGVSYQWDLASCRDANGYGCNTPITIYFTCDVPPTPTPITISIGSSCTAATESLCASPHVCGTDTDHDNHFSQVLGHTGICQPTAYSYDDCYDSNPDAKPGQQNYFSVDRGDGSFDYNCINGEEIENECSPTLPANGYYCQSGPYSGHSGYSRIAAGRACGQMATLRMCYGYYAPQNCSNGVDPGVSGTLSCTNDACPTNAGLTTWIVRDTSTRLRCH